MVCGPSAAPATDLAQWAPLALSAGDTLACWFGWWA